MRLLNRNQDFDLLLRPGPTQQIWRAKFSSLADPDIKKKKLFDFKKFFILYTSMGDKIEEIYMNLYFHPLSLPFLCNSVIIFYNSKFLSVDSPSFTFALHSLLSLLFIFYHYTATPAAASDVPACYYSSLLLLFLLLLFFL